MSNVKHRVTRGIAGAALLPAALALGVSAVPASAQPAASTQSGLVSHAAAKGYWERQGRYDSYYKCFKAGASYYDHHRIFKGHSDYWFHCDHHMKYWDLYVGYGELPDRF